MNLFLSGALSLRRRSVWEAADSGILLWKSSFAYFIPFFALPVWIAACGLRLLPDNAWRFSYLAIWWLKPFFDRLALHVVSRRFFGPPGASRFRDLGRGLWRSAFKGLLGDLLWRRFSPCRSARMPIRTLERMGRKRYRLRKQALAAGGSNFCFLIDALGLAAEGMLLLGEISFAAMLVQMFFPSALDYIRINMEFMEIFIFAAYCFNFILVESLYVCMGFGLYINSRVEVEGWDLQLLFQKFAGAGGAGENESGGVHAGSSGASARALSGKASKAPLFLCFALLLAPAVRAGAEEGERSFAGEPPIPEIESPEEKADFFPPGFPAPGSESMEDLERILASPDFGGEREGWKIQPRNSGECRETPAFEFPPWFAQIRRAFAFALRLFAALAAAAFAVFIFFWSRKYRGRAALFPGRGKEYGNLPLPPENPESLFAGAEEFFRNGMFRDAWAACFAGCLGALKKCRSLAFPPDATEYGCLELARAALPAEAEGFGELTRSWVRLAYGGRVPDKGAFERALAYGRSLLKNPRTAEGNRSEDSESGERA